jgi:hypothetical protein
MSGASLDSVQTGPGTARFRWARLGASLCWEQARHISHDHTPASLARVTLTPASRARVTLTLVPAAGSPRCHDYTRPRRPVAYFATTTLLHSDRLPTTPHCSAVTPTSSDMSSCPSPCTRCTSRHAYARPRCRTSLTLTTPHVAHATLATPASIQFYRWLISTCIQSFTSVSSRVVKHTLAHDGR